MTADKAAKMSYVLSTTHQIPYLTRFIAQEAELLVQKSQREYSIYLWLHRSLLTPLISSTLAAGSIGSEPPAITKKGRTPGSSSQDP